MSAELYTSMKTFKSFVLAVHFLFPSVMVSAQHFSLVNGNPFNMPETLFYKLAFVDIDGDDDYDFFGAATQQKIYYDNNGYPLGSVQYGVLKCYENTGTLTNAYFTPCAYNPFSRDTFNTLGLPSFVDIDDDGDMDAFVATQHNENGIINFYQNIGSATHPSYKAPVVDTLGIYSPSYANSLFFVDFDNDGDEDLFQGGGLPADYYFQENIGNSANASFEPALTNPFGLIGTSAQIVYPEIVDLDKDGDLDLISSDFSDESGSNLFYFEKSGSGFVPAPFLSGVTANPIYNSLSFVDIDGDGDKDLFNSTNDGVVFYLNDETSSIFHKDTENMISVFPNPVVSELNISVRNNTDLNYITIINTLGQEIFGANISSSDENIIINTEPFPLGVYNVQLTRRNGSKILSKFCKQN